MTRPPKWTIICIIFGISLMIGSFQSVFKVECEIASNIKFIAGAIIGLIAPFAWSKPEQKS